MGKSTLPFYVNFGLCLCSVVVFVVASFSDAPGAAVGQILSGLAILVSLVGMYISMNWR